MRDDETEGSVWKRLFQQFERLIIPLNGPDET